MPHEGFYLQPRYVTQRKTRQGIAVNDCLFPHFTINCLILKAVHRAVSTPNVVHRAVSTPNVVNRAVSTPIVLGMKTEQLTLYSTEKKSLLNLDHIRLDYTCKCVQTHSVPMYLALKNGPFMPLNLIPVQGRPVPLLFQMASRFRLGMSSGSKKKSPNMRV
jgi:hypothetical protein